jgi:hypothetical protein
MGDGSKGQRANCRMSLYKLFQCRSLLKSVHIAVDDEGDVGISCLCNILTGSQVNIN